MEENRLRELRNKRSLSLDQVAERIGIISASTLSRYERNEIQRPEPAVQTALAEFYGVSKAHAWGWR